jgi:uncharacterized protein
VPRERRAAFTTECRPLGAPGCRPRCGACCIAPSISPSLPALPHGKPAGQRCPHLTADEACALFGRPERPAVCQGLAPAADMCGDSRAEALVVLSRWERQTAPGG